VPPPTAVITSEFPSESRIVLTKLMEKNLWRAVHSQTPGVSSCAPPACTAVLPSVQLSKPDVGHRVERPSGAHRSTIGANFGCLIAPACSASASADGRSLRRRCSRPRAPEAVPPGAPAAQPGARSAAALHARLHRRAPPCPAAGRRVRSLLPAAVRCAGRPLGASKRCWMNAGGRAKPVGARCLEGAQPLPLHVRTHWPCRAGNACIAADGLAHTCAAPVHVRAGQAQRTGAGHGVPFFTGFDHMTSKWQWASSMLPPMLPVSLTFPWQIQGHNQPASLQICMPWLSLASFEHEPSGGGAVHGGSY
jgi:hypothetical protein